MFVVIYHSSHRKIYMTMSSTNHYLHSLRKYRKNKSLLVFLKNTYNVEKSLLTFVINLYRFQNQDSNPRIKDLSTSYHSTREPPGNDQLKLFILVPINL